MSLSEPTEVLLKRRDVQEQIITWNLAHDAPGSPQVATLAHEGETLIEALIRELEGYIKDDTIVDSIAMSADIATVTINDFRGISGSETLSQMAFEEKRGDITYKGKDRVILDECYKNPELLNQPKSGRAHTPTESSEDSPCPNPYQLKGYIATYNVSPGAPGPQNRGFEVERLWDLRALVEELKRVKDKGVIVSLMYNSETAIITVDAPGGL